MRILVISDSHKRGDVVERIIKREAEAKHVFFLGDVVEDVEDLQYIYDDRTFHIVAGNCDYFSTVKTTDLATVDGVRILYTHGHVLGVKYGIERLVNRARENNCSIALYGHTHVSRTSYEDGIYVVNPGSCSCSRDGTAPSYAVIDITPQGIMPIIKKV